MLSGTQFLLYSFYQHLLCGFLSHEVHDTLFYKHLAGVIPPPCRYLLGPSAAFSWRGPSAALAAAFMDSGTPQLPQPLLGTTCLRDGPHCTFCEYISLDCLAHEETNVKKKNVHHNIILVKAEIQILSWFDNLGHRIHYFKSDNS